MPRMTIFLSDEVYDALERERGLVKRSTYISALIEDALLSGTRGTRTRGANRASKEGDPPNNQ